MQKLRRLSISSIEIKNSYLDRLVELQNLHQLDIQLTTLSEHQCKSLKKLKNLTFLGVEHLKIIPELPNIRHITITTNLEGPSKIKNMSKLQYIDITICDNIDWLSRNSIECFNIWIKSSRGRGIRLDTYQIASLSKL